MQIFLEYIYQFNCAMRNSVREVEHQLSLDICHTGKQYDINLVYSFTARLRGITK